ncbi:hypothetical protein SMD44_04210 [Streptomyces alboflavus]|uniref:Uncharacterized protein n=1 Tax=Streptomyces alboflavus TaxID=67267 RepID=A0A1Z1WE86_9ACTN|nr:hypothetical protein [Streptomyces alboflavus]ARX84756.1 hypothetical protein SMD44_04210 [Streptomyces alboflavus]
MNLTVSTHKIPGYGPTLRTAKQLAPQAVRLVDRAVPGRMPDVEIILTDPRGLAELGSAADAELAGVLDKRTRNRAERAARRLARDAAGRAIPRTNGSVLVLVNIDQHATPGQFAVTLVHELVHAIQFSRKHVIEQVTRDTRAQFGVERQSRRQARTFARLVEQHEQEAYGCEYLADQLIPGATSSAAAA